MDSGRLEGVFPIVATPFRADGSVDLRDLGHLVDFIVGAGVDGVVFPGVASEFDTLAQSERRELVAATADAVAHRVPLVVGVSAPDAEAACAHARQARAVGAAAVMAMAPSAMRDRMAAQVDYFQRIAGEGVPVLLQNAPVPTGCGLAPERIAEIVEAVPGIEYVKEETLPCGQRISKLLASMPTRLKGVFGGAGGRYITDELARAKEKHGITVHHFADLNLKQLISSFASRVVRKGFDVGSATAVPSHFLHYLTMPILA